MNIFKAKRLYMREQPSAFTRWRLTQPSFARLVLPPIDLGGDPLKDWKEWGDRISKRLGHRLPGNWHTSRGIMKRKRALMRLY